MSRFPGTLAACLALLAAACSADDPAGGPCLAGMVRESGPACHLPIADVFTLDGAQSEWSGDLTGVEVPGSCCTTGDSGVTYAGYLRGGGHLAFFSETLGTPSFDDSLVYGLVFRRADLADGAPGQVTSLFLARPDGFVEQYVNEERVFAAGAQVIFGELGVEWLVPLAILPYPGTARVEGVTYERREGGHIARPAAAPAVRICWDEDDPDDPCAGP